MGAPWRPFDSTVDSLEANGAPVGQDNKKREQKGDAINSSLNKLPQSERVESKG